MALIVEDGTGKVDAESYISVADALAYHTSRGNAGWTALASDTVREQCLRRATDYLLQIYRPRWQGTRFVTDQALDWPRGDVSTDGGATFVATDVVPVEVARACAELALKAAGGELLPDQEQMVLREKIGPIKIVYNPAGSPAKRYPSIEGLLAPFLLEAP